MYILAIETTGAYASVALLQADAPGSESRILGVIHGNDRFSHLQNLTPQIDRILKENALSINDVSAVAVSNGPGSFTGIRIGVSTARALSQMLHIPCIPVSSLEALALRAAQGSDGDSAAEDPQSSMDGVLVCPLLDARRKQVYGAAYELIDGKPVCRMEPASCLMTEFLQKLDGSLSERILFIGDGIDTCGEIIRQWHDAAEQAPVITFAPAEIRYQDAATVALRGWQLCREGKTCDYMQLQPEYLRMAEAEKKLKDRLAAESANARTGETTQAQAAGTPTPEQRHD